MYLIVCYASKQADLIYISVQKIGQFTNGAGDTPDN